MQTLIWDIETDGLLKQLTRVHVLVIRDAETRETFVFRKRDASPALELHPVTNPGITVAVEAEDNIADGVAMLEAAGQLVGHNIIAFDIPATRKCYPTFRPRGLLRDSLPLVRVIMPDTSDIDFPMWREGRFPGKLIKSHSLDAWGYRTGARKGDYKAEMEKLGKNPWAGWNQDMEDYCVGDVDVTEVLWAAICKEMPPEQAVDEEHDIHDLCAVMERNGFPFDAAGALKLTEDLRSAYDLVAADAKAAFGPWYKPEKKRRVFPEWDDPEGANKAKYAEDMNCLESGAEPTKRRKYHKHHPEFGEDMSRTWWADVFVPKKTMKVRLRQPTGTCTHTTRMAGTLNPETGFMDGAYCKIVREEFNPGSRDQVIDRFEQVFDWVPNRHDFTENGNPEVNDAVLRALAKRKDKPIPIADKIAECFFLNKYIGQVSNGKKSWLKAYDADTGCIHCYINVGGTVSGRCSHVNPNLGQVPACQERPVRQKDGTPNPQFLSNSGQFIDACFDFTGKEKVEAPLPGRIGEYGWECRALFGVDPAWGWQVGVDLSGIEFRCLAELMLPFDDGELIEVIKSGQDIHAFNQMKTGIQSRNIIKRCLYGLMYGAGDYKLGITADDTLTSDEGAAVALGRQIRAQIMEGLPALRLAIQKVTAEARCGYLIGLDGRKLKCRAEYAALNLRLQGNAALIAKKWMVLTERNALRRGWDHGWFSNSNGDGNGDFVMMAFVHDEMQNAVRDELKFEFGQVSMDSALEVGRHFKFVCPIEAKAKYGHNWAECH
jgi:DNA polymerase family A